MGRFDNAAKSKGASDQESFFQTLAKLNSDALSRLEEKIKQRGQGEEVVNDVPMTLCQVGQRGYAANEEFGLQRFFGTNYSRVAFVETAADDAHVFVRYNNGGFKLVIRYL